MRKILALLVVLALVSPAAAVFTEDFNSYPQGAPLTGQGPWGPGLYGPLILTALEGATGTMNPLGAWWASRDNRAPVGTTYETGLVVMTAKLTSGNTSVNAGPTLKLTDSVNVSDVGLGYVGVSICRKEYNGPETISLSGWGLNETVEMGNLLAFYTANYPVIPQDVDIELIVDLDTNYVACGWVNNNLGTSGVLTGWGTTVNMYNPLWGYFQYPATYHPNGVEIYTYNPGGVDNINVAPEPATMALLGIGGVVALLKRRR